MHLTASSSQRGISRSSHSHKGEWTWTRTYSSRRRAAGKEESSPSARLQDRERSRSGCSSMVTSGGLHWRRRPQRPPTSSCSSAFNLDASSASRPAAAAARPYCPHRHPPVSSSNVLVWPLRRPAPAVTDVLELAIAREEEDLQKVNYRQLQKIQLSAKIQKIHTKNQFSSVNQHQKSIQCTYLVLK